MKLPQHNQSPTHTSNMHIYYMSDLHLEWRDYDLSYFESVYPRPTLILAGDIYTIRDLPGYYTFIERACELFKNVIHVCGNHEFYGTSINTGLSYIEEHKRWGFLPDNYTVLENSKKTLRGGITVIGATLWTKIPHTKEGLIRGHIADYSRIWSDQDVGFVTPEEISQRHALSVNRLNQLVYKEKQKGKKTIVVTHHLPSFRSIVDKYRDSVLNNAFATETSLFKHRPDYIIHGHSHSSVDYKTRFTQVLSNPRGYKLRDGSEENTDFNPLAMIEV